jgi:hypothetical protein
MKKYSIVRIGDEYVVRAGDNSVLKIASRRRAAQLVTDAAELLSQPPRPPDAEPSIAGDPEGAPDAAVVPESRVIPDPKVIPDPSKLP